MLWARAASRIFFTLGTLAWQRGRTPQLAFMKSSRRSAVVFGSTVTGLSSGAGGAFTVAQSATMSPAKADWVAVIAATANAAHASPRAKFVVTLLMKFVIGGPLPCAALISLAIGEPWLCSSTGQIPVRVICDSRLLLY